MATEIEQNRNWPDILKDKIDLEDHIDKNCNKKNDGWDHGDKHQTSSGRCLFIYENGTKWKCHSCHEGGDIIDFETDYNGTEFIDACESLAEEYGIELPYGKQNGTSPESAAFRKEMRQKKKDINQFIHDVGLWFHQQALDNPKAMKYFTDRGISEETVSELKLGWSPPGSKLYKAFKDRYEEDTMLSSGLIRDGEDGKYSFFRNRYIFPYWKGNPSRSDSAKIVFLIGRASLKKDEDGGKKYIKMALHSDDKNPQIMEGAINHILWGKSEFDKDRPTLITEGIVDAILARQEIGDKYNVISPVTTQLQNDDINSYAEIIDKMRPKKPLVICNDTEENESGEDGALRMAKKIRDRFNELNPPDESEDKSEESEQNQYNPIIKIARLRKTPEQGKVDVADYIQNGRQSELIYWLDAARSIWEYEAYLNNDPRRFFQFSKNQSDSNRFKPKNMRDELMSEGRFFISIAESLYIYDNGVYKKDKSGETKKIIMRKLGDRTTPHMVNSAITDLLDYTSEDVGIIGKPPDDNIINVRNGLFDLNQYLQTGDLRDIKEINHDPYRLSFIQFPVDFNPDARCPKIESFLTEVLNSEEDIIELGKAIGYTLRPKMNIHKAFFFYGSGRNGKGVTLSLIKSLIGDDNFSTHSLKTLETDKFARHGLFGKSANICGEISDKYMKDTEAFKSLTGDDTISAEEKYKPQFFYKPFAKFFFSANELPRSRDKTTAMKDRWVFFGFDKTFLQSDPETDPNLFDKLNTDEEMSGLLNLSLVGLFNLDNEKFILTNRGSELHDDWNLADNPIQQFFDEVLEYDETCGSNVSKSWMYKCFRSHVSENNPDARIDSAIKFNQSIKRVYDNIEEKHSECKLSSQSGNCWFGFKITDPLEDRFKQAVKEERKRKK